jgi:hypothetical protein
MLSRPTISAIARMLRGMLEAIGITDVALADGGGREKECWSRSCRYSGR